MKAYEFPAKVTSEGKIEFPEAVLKQLTANQDIRVIVLVNEAIEENDDTAWHRLAAEQFFKDYSDADAIYDKI
ncbi:hypothetical protein GS682_16300 [Nostoc sp. B(2019)]|nr:hypothetical protein [Nostoc sp. B(2019)]